MNLPVFLQNNGAYVSKNEEKWKVHIEECKIQNILSKKGQISKILETDLTQEELKKHEKVRILVFLIFLLPFFEFVKKKFLESFHSIYDIMNACYENEEEVEKTRENFVQFGKLSFELFGLANISAYIHVVSSHGFTQLKQTLGLSKFSQQGLLK